VTDRRTDRRTDGQNYDSQDSASIAASRGKNCFAYFSRSCRCGRWGVYNTCVRSYSLSWQSSWLSVFPSVLSRCRLGDRKGIRSANIYLHHLSSTILFFLVDEGRESDEQTADLVNAVETVCTCFLNLIYLHVLVWGICMQYGKGSIWSKMDSVYRAYRCWTL